MADDYNSLLGPRRGPAQVRHTGSTPQHQALSGRSEEMHRNAAGGMVFTLDDWSTLRRFLILGTTQGTYYASANKLGAEALVVLDRCLEADPKKTVDVITSVSVAGSPLKQSPCLFALARACSRLTGNQAFDADNKHPVTVGRAYALSQAPLVLRTLQHVFEFLEYCRRQRGGGSGLTRLLRTFTLNPRLGDVEYQALKYRNRDGWSPRDLLRYSRPRATGVDDVQRDQLFAWIVKPESEKGRLAVAASERLAGYEQLRAGVPLKEAVALIEKLRFTHEFVPNELLGERDVWQALLPNLPMTALTRNLRKMTQVGLLVDGSDAVLTLKERLLNANNLRKARVHPLRLMMAERQYRSGTDRRGGSFSPSGEVLSVLEDALELSWSAVEPLKKSVLVAVDDSGSMGQASGAAELTAFEAGIALAMWYRRTERVCQLVTFTDSNSTRELNVSSKVTWNELVRIPRTPRGTDLAEPISWLNRNKKDAEVIIQITDNETYAGHSHVAEELGKLRKRVQHPVAFVNVGVTSTKGTVGDPKDPHTLNVVGFDPTVPEAIAAHVKEAFGEN